MRLAIAEGERVSVFPEGNYTLQVSKTEYITLDWESTVPTVIYLAANCSTRDKARSSGLNLTQLMYNFFRFSPSSDPEYLKFMGDFKSMTDCVVKPDENDLYYVRLGEDPKKSLMVYFAGKIRTLVHE
mmetsp:Transcript_7007/g.7876  ORF Transcript_7007/g.7876 Transcript_7007/m.7876 type:complete len:128 (-) Transcript_7007:27-410(-)